MEIVKEGKARFYSYSGKPTKDMPVFYNPEMGRQRDITVCSIAAFQRRTVRGIDVCDPLAGSGVRGIRILKEVDGIGKVLLNDVSSESVKLIKRNLKANKAEADVCHKDARILLFENRSSFDFVDVDPFGSPVKYLEAAAFSIRHNGLFAATATDMGALAGSFPNTCFRRYGIRVCKTDFYLELGIRVLITNIQQAFSRYGAAFSPLLSHTGHYFRVIGSVEKSRAAADRILERVGFVSYCKKCLWRVFEHAEKCGNCKGNVELIGPIWLGPIQNNGFVTDVLREAENRGMKIKFIGEADEPMYYDLSVIYSKHKLPSVPVEKVIERLKNFGSKASRSSLCPTGVKTDAPITDVVKAIKTIS